MTKQQKIQLAILTIVVVGLGLFPPLVWLLR